MSRPPPESGCQEPAKLACSASASLWRIAARVRVVPCCERLNPVKSEEGMGDPRLQRIEAPPHRLHLAYHGGRRVDGGAEVGRSLLQPPPGARSIHSRSRAASERVAESGRIATPHGAAVAMSASGHETLPAPLSALGEAIRRSPQPVRRSSGDDLADRCGRCISHLRCRSHLRAVPCNGFDAAVASKWCGQYECVGLAPLSEEEAKVSLERLAALPRRDEKRPAPGATSSVRTHAIAVSARD
jgi:hypothetical protein